MNRSSRERLLAWMEDMSYPRFTILRPANFAWLTGGGDNTVVVGEGVAWLEVASGKVVLHASRIEVARLVKEGVEGMDEVKVYPWYALPEPGKPNDLEHDLTPP